MARVNGEIAEQLTRGGYQIDFQHTSDGGDGEKADVWCLWQMRPPAPIYT